MTGNLSEGLVWTLRPREAIDFGAEFATLSDEGRSGYNRWLSATIKQKQPMLISRDCVDFYRASGRFLDLGVAIEARKE
jgi:hypothetical protein